MGYILYRAAESGSIQILSKLARGLFAAALFISVSAIALLAWAHRLPGKIEEDLNGLGLNLLIVSVAIFAVDTVRRWAAFRQDAPSILRRIYLAIFLCLAFYFVNTDAPQLLGFCISKESLNSFRLQWENGTARVPAKAGIYTVTSVRRTKQGSIFILKNGSMLYYSASAESPPDYEIRWLSGGWGYVYALSAGNS
jgi:hypothetical protein